MPKITIIRFDNQVYVDNKVHTVDCSALDPAIRAIQWDGKKGHIEYEADELPNDVLKDIRPYQAFVDAWQAIEDTPPPDPVPEPTLTKEERFEVDAKARGFASGPEYAKHILDEAAKA